MLGLDEKIICENCGTQTTMRNIVRHKTRCSIGNLFCTQVLNFPQNPKVIRIILLLRSTAPQKLRLPSSVKFVNKIFPAFTPCANIETPNMAFPLGQQIVMLTLSSTKLLMRILKKSWSFLPRRL